MDQVRILLVDDHPLIREGMRSLLQNDPNIAVVGEAGNGLEAIDAANALNPDIILMDIRMPGMDGVEATKRISSQPNAPRIVILSSFDEDEKVIAALGAGAAGYLLKDAPPQQLLRAIRTVADGYSLMAPQVGQAILQALNRNGTPCAKRIDMDDSPLTPREAEVLALLAQGHNNRDIAASLFISEKTVKTHVSNIFAKLQISERSQAVLYAARRGMVS